MSWGDRIAELRERHGLTQEELASRVGVARSSLSHYETNRRQPDFGTMVALADIFGVSIDYLAGRDAPPEWARCHEIGCLLDRLELSDKSVIENYDMCVDGKRLTQEEMQRFIAFVRAERMMRKLST